jgi:hypothetical protein
MAILMLSLAEACEPNEEEEEKGGGSNLRGGGKFSVGHQVSQALVKVQREVFKACSKRLAARHSPVDKLPQIKDEVLGDMCEKIQEEHGGKEHFTLAEAAKMLEGMTSLDRQLLRKVLQDRIYLFCPIAPEPLDTTGPSLRILLL